MKTTSARRMTIAFMTAFISALFISCQKENSFNSEPPLSDEQVQLYAEESREAEISLGDGDDLVLITAEEEGLAAAGGRPFLPTFEELRLRIGNCATITVTPEDGSYPKTILIDFGTGCLCPDGKWRKGKLELHFTAPIRQPHAVVTLTFIDYFLNRASIKGKKIFKNKTENGVFKFSIQAIGIDVEFPNGRGYKYNGKKDVEQVAGMATLSLRDDVYEITGLATIKLNNGPVIHLKTNSALVKKIACAWISNGVLQIKIKNKTYLLDFGYPDNGACDNLALLTWNNGNNQNIIVLP